MCVIVCVIMRTFVYYCVCHHAHVYITVCVIMRMCALLCGSSCAHLCIIVCVVMRMCVSLCVLLCVCHYVHVCIFVHIIAVHSVQDQVLLHPTITRTHIQKQAHTYTHKHIADLHICTPPHVLAG